MAGATTRARGRGVAAALLAAAMTAIGSAPVAAAGEPPFQVLSETFVAGVTADLDGDGARDVVAITADAAGGTRFVVEAWTLEGSSWASMGRAPLLRQDEATEILVPTNPVVDAVGLLVLSAGTRHRVIALAVGEPGSNPAGCCLTISDVTAPDGRLRVEPDPETFGPAAMVTALDTDGDGVDELLLTEPVFRDVPQQPATDPAGWGRLLRQTPAGFRSEPIRVPEGAGPLPVSVVGETDGIRGDDIVFGPDGDGVLYRLYADAGGDLAMEAADTDELEWRTRGGWFAGAAGGALVSVESGIGVARWPRGGELGTVARRAGRDFPSIFVFGDGPSPRLVDLGGLAMGTTTPAGLSVLGLDLETEMTVDPNPVLGELWRLAALETTTLNHLMPRIYPYVGPLPGGLADGRQAFLAAGTLLTLDEHGALDARHAAPLAGVGPVGVAGPDGDWLAVGQGWYSIEAAAYLFPRPPSDVNRLSVMPLASVIDVGADDGRLEVELTGATTVSGPDGERVVAADGGFEATLSGPPGSLVFALAGRSVVEDTELADEAITIAMAPLGSRSGNQAFRAAVVLITPTGSARIASWDAEILREAPELSAAASVDLFSLRSVVDGRVPPGTVVAVDGRPVEVSRSGAFRVEVDAPIWPREVTVVARDPVGNEAVERMEIVGLVDYRGLPWVAIVALVTLLAGLAMFLRTPRHRPMQLGTELEGRLEEIDGD